MPNTRMSIMSKKMTDLVNLSAHKGQEKRPKKKYYA